MIITNRLIQRIAKQYMPDAQYSCYAELQYSSIAGNKVVLLMNQDTLKVVILNFFQTKGADHYSFTLNQIKSSSVKISMMGIDALWTLTFANEKWHFRIVKKIITLGSKQREFIGQIKKIKNEIQ